MSFTEEQKQLPATNFDFEDGSVLDDFLEEIREGLASELGISAVETETEFSDATVLAYLTEHHLEERVTVESAIAGTVKHAAARFRMRPRSGHESERSRAASDDPVGLARDRERFGALHERRKIIQTAMRAELEAAKGRRAR